MAYTRVITGFVLIGALAAAPVFARGEDDQRRRSGSDRRGDRAAQQAPRSNERQGGARAVPRSQESARQNDNGRRQDDARRQPDAQRQYQPQRQYDSRSYNDSRRATQRPYYSNRGGYGSRIIPRIIRPSIVTIVPYRPYVYRPSFGIGGGYYGAGGSYPYGYTPRGYYDPLPGRYYGGLRITDAPREAQVFADGYYVGIVNDFDGVFQHMNLEAGNHRIEIESPGFGPVAFDVMVQPGRTITYRADMYPY